MHDSSSVPRCDGSTPFRVQRTGPPEERISTPIGMVVFHISGDRNEAAKTCAIVGVRSSSGQLRRKDASGTTQYDRAARIPNQRCNAACVARGRPSGGSGAGLVNPGMKNGGARRS